MIQVGIVGGTGYTGVELLRLLSQHAGVELSVITSRAEEGVAVADLFPSLRGRVELTFTAPDIDRLVECDIVFFATPNGVAQSLVPSLLKSQTRVIDLSADFRLRDAQSWAHWYGQPHACPALLSEAVYGLPELSPEQRQAICSAALVACPGCYPTAVQLGFIPLLENNVVEASHLIANVASGASGAGRQAKVDNLLTEIGDSFKAYACAGHRHLPEIEQGLTALQADTRLTFVPHLLPIARGIHATLYGKLRDTSIDLHAIFTERYREEMFVDVMPSGSHPQTRSVKGANVCRLSVFQPQQRDTVVVLSVIDNLTKGAAGQAVQNMNIMCDFEEHTGLTHLALIP